MAFLVLEIFGGADCAYIITNDDGSNKVFNTRSEAEEEVDDCQQGLVIEI